MKIVIITDSHLGVRNGSSIFLKYQLDRWEELFSYMKSNGIKTLLHGGDFFDNRNFLTMQTLSAARDFSTKLASHGIDMFMIVGNHDVAYKNDNTINSPEFILQSKVIWEHPETITFDGCKIDMIPWINKNNSYEISEFIRNSTSEVCLGHFEIKGASFQKGGVICKNGISHDIFSKYKKVMSGHFHTRSKVGCVEYIGAAFDYTWADWNDPRGYVVFDTETLCSEHIDWKDFMFVMGEVEDNGKVEYVPKCDNVSGKFVRLVCHVNTPLVDETIKKIESEGPAELKIFFNDIVKIDKITVNLTDIDSTDTIMKRVIQENIEDECLQMKVHEYLKNIHNMVLTKRGLV